MAKDNMSDVVKNGDRIITTRSRRAADDEVQVVLQTFTFELPDPHQELFFQCPSTFPLFPDFPVEIRRLIWKETFPQTKHLWCWGFRSEEYCYHLRNIPPQISAHIHQESRAETLQHYSMLLPSATPCGSFGYNTPSSTRKPPPIFWNGERDILSLYIRSPRTFYTIQQSSGTRLLETDHEIFWRRHFTNDLQSFLACVRTLELRVRGWDNTWTRWLENGALCRLKNFVALKEVRVVDVNLAEGHAVITGSRARDSLDTLTGIFRDLAAANPEISRPTIVIMKGVVLVIEELSTEREERSPGCWMNCKMGKELLTEL